MHYDERFNSMHHNYAFLKEVGHQDRLGYYLDGSSSHWTLENNVIHNCKVPLYTQFNIPCQYSHHSTINGFYSTTAVNPSNNRPYHDVYMTNCVVIPDLDELFRQYPEAKAIVDGAGYKGLL